MRALLLSSLVLATAVGCSSSADRSPTLEPPASGGSGGSGGSVAIPDSLEFEPLDRTLMPREQVELTVTTSPVQPYRVRFSLPSGDDGDPLDAVLDRSEADTDDAGRATVQLTAPSNGAQFSVRASIASAISASLPITVMDATTATLQVQPSYGGVRPILTWVATARPGSCAEKPGIPPPDGPIMAFASSGSAPELNDVPAGVPLAVTLRSGHYIGGCSSIDMLAAGPKERPESVKVTVLDRPIDVWSNSLSFTLGLAYPDAAWSALNADAAGSVQTALLGSSVDDVAALLDAMRDGLSVSDGQSLESARKAENWDGLLRARWGASAATRLRDTAGGWLTLGAAKLGSGEHVFEGSLDPIDAKSAQLSLLTVAGLPATDAGFISPAFVSWSAGSDDTVVLGTTLYLSSSRLVTALAETIALASNSEATSSADALGLALDCAGLASQLAAAGADASWAFAGCDANCLLDACNQAVSDIWERGRDATTTTPAELGVTAAGTARVGDAAELAGIPGTWVGQLKSASKVAATGGLLTVAEPPAATH